MAEWRKIESAPKDGTAVLLYLPVLHNHSIQIVGWWHRGEKDIYPHWDGYGDIGINALNDVTHWQPLPPPPTEDG